MTDENEQDLVKLVNQLCDSEICDFAFGYDINTRHAYKKLLVSSWKYILKYDGQPTVLRVEYCPNGIYEITRTIDDEGNQLYCLVSKAQFQELLRLTHEKNGDTYIFK